MISFECINVEVPEFSLELFSFWLNEVAVEEGCSIGEITLIFCSDAHLLEMNQQYLKHDYYTDIITFDYSEHTEISGDLFVSIDRVYENAFENTVTRELELKRVCVHGVLHLCGYGDKSEEESRIMRSKENYYIDKYVSRET